MSYDIYIGNAELESEWPGDGYGPVAEWVVSLCEHTDAPCLPYDPTGRSNCRSPGYIAWPNFCEEAGIMPMWCDENAGFLRPHPGIKPLLPEHLATVRLKRIEWEAKHPDAIPGWDYNAGMFPAPAGEWDDGVRGRDSVLARLIWMEWWMGWALDNCERPAIYNR